MAAEQITARNVFIKVFGLAASRPSSRFPAREAKPGDPEEPDPLQAAKLFHMLDDQATFFRKLLKRKLSMSRELAERALSHCGLEIFAPAQIVAAGNVFARFADRHFRNGFQYPFEISLTNRARFRVRRGIAKIDRVRNAIPNRELDR